MLTEEALNTLFTDARTHNRWTDRAVSEAQLRQLYDLMKWGPTSANSAPARIVFVRSPQAREQLAACMGEGNRDKTRAAPVTAIIGMDMAFYDQLPTLFPHADARSWFVGNDEAIRTTALRNASLQGAYLMLAARALGLDCGPMSGFDAAQVEAAFFAGSTVKVNFVCSLGYGDPAGLYPRGPRLAFEYACKIA